jgi:predicted MFS family arabinose efflux permease
MIGTAAPVAWWTWVSKALPNEAEAGGGLMVAVIQLAITLGASLGGMLFDGWGYQATFLASAALLIASALVAVLARANQNAQSASPPRHRDTGDDPSAIRYTVRAPATLFLRK